MEKENKKSSIALRIIFFVLLGIISASLIYYTSMSIISIKKSIDEINERYSYNQIEKTTIDERFFNDSTFVSLQKEKAFYQSRLKMAETDSIGLTIDLPDSLACLEINGVVVHKVKINYMTESKVFSKANTYSVATMLSRPLTIVNRFSTIKREPLMIKMAPKDTSEYVPDIAPDTSDFEPVNYILEMDNGVRIFVYQEDKKKSEDGYCQKLFDLKDRLRNTKSTIDSLKRNSVPKYHPFIKIRLPKADAKIIYRALPENGQVVIFR
ncbi:MAG: hypothetical protein AB9846_01840 [Tenuifilaceae bacterium]